MLERHVAHRIPIAMIPCAALAVPYAPPRSAKKGATNGRRDFVRQIEKEEFALPLSVGLFHVKLSSWINEAHDAWPAARIS
eukprot:scaffold1048_cov59-Attheya_sp.AAC.4